MTQAEAQALLAECRRKIDAMDLELRELLNRRAGIVDDVVRAKEALAMPVYEASREEDVVRKVTNGNPGPLSDEAFRHIFETIMREMRMIQQVYLDQRRGKPRVSGEWRVVTVAGVGLIGGSFALALRQAGFKGKIIGVSSPATDSSGAEARGDRSSTAAGGGGGAIGRCLSGATHRSDSGNAECDRWGGAAGDADHGCRAALNGRLSSGRG